MRFFVIIGKENKHFLYFLKLLKYKTACDKIYHRWSYAKKKII